MRWAVERAMRYEQNGEKRARTSAEFVALATPKRVSRGERVGRVLFGCTVFGTQWFAFCFRIEILLLISIRLQISPWNLKA